MKITYPIALVTFLIYITILIGVSIYSGKLMAKTKLNKYVEEFYTGGRGFGAIVVAMMIVAGLCSAGTFLGGPGLVWQLGAPFVLIAVAQNFMNFYVLGEFGKKIGIIARRIKAQSFIDILMHRYEKNIVIILGGTIAIIVFLEAYVSAQFIGGARILEIITGFPYL
jgi:sodium/pantothenate symporter